MRRIERTVFVAYGTVDSVCCEQSNPDNKVEHRQSLLRSVGEFVVLTGVVRCPRCVAAEAGAVSVGRGGGAGGTWHALIAVITQLGTMDHHWCRL